MTEILIPSPHPSPLRGEGKGEGWFAYLTLDHSCLAVGREIYLACLRIVPPCGTKAGIWNLIIWIYFF